MTENGWPSCGSDQLDRTPTPGTGGMLVVPLQKGIPSKILKAFMADLNQFIESANNSRGYTDEGGWTPTNSVPTSNHLGGTAFDYNWTDHPMGNANAGWDGSDLIPGDQVPAVRELLKWYEGMVFWGNDWDSPKDGMHFQMGYNTFNNQNKCRDFIGRKIRADGFSTYKRGGTGMPNPPAGPILSHEQKTDVIFSELTKLFGSRSPYRADDKSFDTLAGRLLDTERQMNMLMVEVAALRGEQWAINLVRLVADGVEAHPGIWLWYAGANGKRIKDDWAINHAKAIMERIERKSK